MLAPKPQPGPLDASVFVEALRAHAGTFIALVLIAHAILWTLVPLVAEPTPDPKIAAGLAIGREWLLGYPGLPPLALWTLAGAYKLVPSIAAMKALGPIAVALAGWFVFGFARRVVGEQHGALATLVLVGVQPVTFPVGALDSAAIQMPLVAGLVLSWWRAIRDGNRTAWLLFGIAAALLFYAGAQGLLVLALLLIVTATGSGKAALRRHNAYAPAFAALVIFALLAAPRLWWLLDHDFSGLYEDSTAGFEPYGVMKGYEAVAGAIAGHVGLLLLIAVATPIFVRGKVDAVSFMREPLPGFALVTVLLLATLPFAAAATVVLVLGQRTTIDAFGALLLFSGLLMVVLGGGTIRICRQHLAAAIAAILLVLPPVLVAGIELAAPWTGSRGLVTNWPAQEAARAMTGIFRNRTGKPVGLVIAEPVYASEFALASRDRPQIFPNADRALAPWVKDDTLQKKGAIVFWPVVRGNAAPPASLAAKLPPFTPEAPLSLPWRHPGNLDPVGLGWAIIPPEK